METDQMERKIKNICIAGAGGIGGFFAVKLLKTEKYNVSIIARGRHLDAVKKHGLILETADGHTITGKPHLATNSFDDIPLPDLTLITVKGYDLDEVSQKLVQRINVFAEDEHTNLQEKQAPAKNIILPLLNGVDIYERVKNYAANRIVLPGCVYIGSHIEKPGVIAQTGGTGLIIFGNDPEYSDFNPKNIFEVFDDAGINYRWEENPFPAIWEKYIFIASFALVSAYSGKTFGEIRKDSTLNNLTKRIAEEITEIAEARNISLPQNIVNETLKKADLFPPDTKTSYQRDVEIPGKPNEGELFGGTIIRLGKKHGIKTSVTESVYREIQKNV
ncbi:MAG: 2-dehydropantoate 2-reductase [Spirochaetes bacterium]|nr:2-dehydropantoate 2-reductase [Spirochaetota bacterium]